MSASNVVLPRRGFLCGLAKLPLIGGGLTITGSPGRSAPVIPISPPPRTPIDDAISAAIANRRRRLRLQLAAAGLGPEDEVILREDLAACEQLQANFWPEQEAAR